MPFVFSQNSCKYPWKSLQPTWLGICQYTGILKQQQNISTYVRGILEIFLTAYDREDAVPMQVGLKYTFPFAHRNRQLKKKIQMKCNISHNKTNDWFPYVVALVFDFYWNQHRFELTTSSTLFLPCSSQLSSRLLSLNTFTLNALSHFRNITVSLEAWFTLVTWKQAQEQLCARLGQSVGKISDCQPGGPGFNPRPGRGLNLWRPSFATVSVFG